MRYRKRLNALFPNRVEPIPQLLRIKGLIPSIGRIRHAISRKNNISMQIAATNPLSISRDEIDQSVLDREKEIFADQAKESGKPDNIIDKIVDGKVEKYFAESCLLEQQYIKDPDRKVFDLITESVATLGENIVINRFIRFAIGETSLNGKS